MAAAPSFREDFVYMAKLFEQVERYDEMVEFMKKVSASANSEEERNLFSWTVSSIEQKEESCDNEYHP
ncbi:hypothetical protein GQ457_13G012910 [Hibiscus cannabinus]